MNEIDGVTTLLLILFIIIWMYQGTQIGNIVLADTWILKAVDDDKTDINIFIKFLSLTVIVWICWPGAMALHMLRTEEEALNNE